jgi:hypothetical protein
MASEIDGDDEDQTARDKGTLRRVVKAANNCPHSEPEPWGKADMG